MLGFELGVGFVVVIGVRGCCALFHLHFCDFLPYENKSNVIATALYALISSVAAIEHALLAVAM